MKFLINRDYNDPKTVEADSWEIADGFVVFSVVTGDTTRRVYAKRTEDVYTVEEIK